MFFFFISLSFCLHFLNGKWNSLSGSYVIVFNHLTVVVTQPRSLDLFSSDLFSLFSIGGNNLQL